MSFQTRMTENALCQQRLFKSEEVKRLPHPGPLNCFSTGNALVCVDHQRAMWAKHLAYSSQVFSERHARENFIGNGKLAVNMLLSIAMPSPNAG
jgi:hypothetical protein